MVLKRSIFGKYVKESISEAKREVEQTKKGFRTPPKRKIKLSNPFYIFNLMFRYNRDYTLTPFALVKE